MKQLTVALLAAVLVVAPLAAQTPNHREGAPFRGKLSPPHAEGQVLVVKGRVTDATTGEGVAHAVLDAFQADAEGRYDADGFEYRARVLTDEQGHFEFETIVPSNYGPAPHIHFFVTGLANSCRPGRRFLTASPMMWRFNRTASALTSSWKTWSFDRPLVSEELFAALLDVFEKQQRITRHGSTLSRRKA